MLEFLASIMDCGGNVPMFGDADDGFVVRLDPRPRASAASARCSPPARCSSGAATSSPRRGALDDKTRWLLGADADARVRRARRGEARLPVRRAFPEGGYYILGCDFETPDEIRLVADAGPLGYRAIAAHGHADALSFTLSVGGLEFLVDPGTYAYHTQPEWRAYFRGTAAHNTVRIDGRDQSQPGRQLHVAAQGARRLQPVADLGGAGHLRGLARRLLRARRPGDAPPPHRARQGARAAS